MPPLPMIWPVHEAGLKVDGEVEVLCSRYCWLGRLAVSVAAVSSTSISVVVVVEPPAAAPVDVPKDTEDTTAMSTSRTGDGASDGG